MFAIPYTQEVKKIMTKKKAKQILEETRELSTNLLKPLGLSFEVFLRYAQIKDKAEREKVIDRILLLY